MASEQSQVLVQDGLNVLRAPLVGRHVGLRLQAVDLGDVGLDLVEGGGEVLPPCVEFGRTLFVIEPA